LARLCFGNPAITTRCAGDTALIIAWTASAVAASVLLCEPMVTALLLVSLFAILVETCAGDTALIVTWTASAIAASALLCVPMVAGLLLGGPVASGVFRQSVEISAQVGRFCARLAPSVVPQVCDSFARFAEL
jgi:hypothetical protein